MKIAVIHSFYTSRQPSGENVAVRDQVRALRAAGHDVELFAAHTDELAENPLYTLRAAARVASGRGHSPLARLRAYAPDVVHVHNLFPNFGRSWVPKWDGPLVATLHNYRPLCAGTNLYRSGAVCTRCPDGERWAGLRHGCYRNSRAATLPLAWAGRNGPTRDPLLARADRLVVLSRLSERTYRQAGLPVERLMLVPNFVDAPQSDEAEPDDTGRWLVAARLTAEKGVLELLRQWPAHESLDVIGDGELLAACRAAAPSSVRFLGSLDRAELRRRMPSWRGLVFPSRCYEGAPCLEVEALAAGLPILAFEGSSVAESVHALGTGLVTRWNEPLAPVLTEAATRFPSLRVHCRRVYTGHFTEQAWTTRITRTYEEATHVAVSRTP
ncbi:glycosyltransferase family 4 protein [Streptomyces camelliae]|uniref:Glycosyltransferase family 4 protein n=1 Tax=Streptomyces camelliae TaxID=3004093 RepID=A0ABY7P313_9ACTN|nr:glycosyltransferase family 4 protein [Streptomyces sp. HUAS 2-6]WBO64913.1 glycosyltransferase family 4 protein [Streptomyces sp. HUAS 2-6]